MNIVLLGGSFDPIHFGHLNILKQAITEVEADEGWFILANQAPLKDSDQLDFEIRAHFIEIMIKNEKQFKLSRIEKELATPNYTYNTIVELRKRYPDYEFFYLIGADQANQFKKWFQYKELLELVQILVYPRNDEPIHLLKNMTLIKASEYDISSTEIRNGSQFDTHPDILNEIALNGYYSQDRLNTYLSEYRKQHTFRVTECARQLASIHNLDIGLMTGIAIAHDLCKEMSEKELSQYLTSFEKQQATELWHAYASTRYHAQHYFVRNEHFLSAIYHHTLGSSNDPYAQVLYIADKCEPGRKGSHNQEIIELSKKDLEQGFKLCRKIAQEYYERKKNAKN